VFQVAGRLGYGIVAARRDKLGAKFARPGVGIRYVMAPYFASNRGSILRLTLGALTDIDLVSGMSSGLPQDDRQDWYLFRVYGRCPVRVLTPSCAGPGSSRIPRFSAKA
jgi:hypothetical protein